MSWICEKGHVIWAGLGRAKAPFEHFFKDIPTDYLEQVEAVAMDMNASYNLLVEQYLPQATIVYDRYHMQAQFGREVMQQLVWKLSKYIANRLTNSLYSRM